MRKLLTGILDTEKRYTTETALAMPEAGYSYKPADSVWEFRELIHHMVYSIDWMNASYLEGRKTDWNPGIVTGNKDELVKAVTVAFSRLEETLSGSTISDETLVPAFYSILIHNAHHRGQATTYLRCKGIIPPEYPF